VALECIPYVGLHRLCHYFHCTSNRIAREELIPAQITIFISSSNSMQVYKFIVPNLDSIQQKRTTEWWKIPVALYHENQHCHLVTHLVIMYFRKTTHFYHWDLSLFNDLNSNITHESHYLHILLQSSQV